MLDRTLALFAYIVLCLFVGILLFKLQRLDLFVVAGATLVLAGWDMLSKKT